MMDKRYDPDDVYEILVQLGRDLTPDEGSIALAAMVVLLAHEVGDATRLHGAVDQARSALAAYRNSLASANPLAFPKSRPHTPS